MRVLFVTSAYPAHRDDARGIFIHRLARALVREGVEVGVLAPGAFRAPSHEVIDGVVVWRATYWLPRGQRLTVGLGGIVPNLRQRPWLIVQVPALIAALAARAARMVRGFDVIHAHWVYPAGLAVAPAALRRHVPLVLTAHGGDLNLARRSRLLRGLVSRVSRAADACVGVSGALREDFISMGVASESAVVIPYGVEMRDPAGDSVAHVNVPARFTDFDGLRIAYVGSLIHRKSVRTLIEAQAELESKGRAVTCAVVGSGPQLRMLRDLTQTRGLRNVIFAGETPPAAVPRWMAAADILILPSLSEGRPNVVLEAMALGRPVIATDIAGTRELVRDGVTGLLFPSGDALALADRINQLLGNEARRREMGKCAREQVRADGLDTDSVARRYATLYEQLVAKRRSESSRSSGL